jgi:hypothetical protein
VARPRCGESFAEGGDVGLAASSFVRGLMLRTPFENISDHFRDSQCCVLEGMWTVGVISHMFHGEHPLALRSPRNGSDAVRNVLSRCGVRCTRGPDDHLPGTNGFVDHGTGTAGDLSLRQLILSGTTNSLLFLDSFFLGRPSSLTSHPLPNFNFVLSVTCCNAYGYSPILITLSTSCQEPFGITIRLRRRKDRVTPNLDPICTLLTQTQN